MTKQKYSVWYFPYSTRYYLLHPWKWFHHLRISIRDMFHRARYGWCYGDVWDWDNWFMNVVPSMFRYLAEHGSAYPGRLPFDTPEKWHEWLNHIADTIETGTEEWQDEHNEFYKEYMDELMDKWEPPVKGDDGYYHQSAPKQTPLDKNYFQRCMELGEQAEKNIQYALGQIAEHFYQIWD